MESIPRPSGKKLPRLLRKRLPEESWNGRGRGELSNRVFSTEELEERIWKTSVAMVDIQKQIFKGEEQYYEDTPVCNILKGGFEGYVDAKDLDFTSRTTRIPNDSRWFSNSCMPKTTLPKPVAPPPPTIVNPVTSDAANEESEKDTQDDETNSQSQEENDDDEDDDGGDEGEQEEEEEEEDEEEEEEETKSNKDRRKRKTRDESDKEATKKSRRRDSAAVTTTPKSKRARTEEVQTRRSSRKNRSSNS